MANIERLERLYTWAAQQEVRRRAGLPSEWDQAKWVSWDNRGCGTACCIAGKAALDDGVRPIPALPVHGNVDEFYPYVVLDRDGERVAIDSVAMRVLDLTSDQADLLFDSRNTLEDLRFLIDRFAEGVTDWDVLFDALETDREVQSR